MHTRFMVRMAAPVVAISVFLFGVVVGTAWLVQRWQKTVSQDLRVNISGVRAAEELEILVRETRTRLDLFLITGNRKHLARVPAMRAEIEYWTGEAERWGVTAREQELVERVQAGQQQFWSQLARLAAQDPSPGLTQQVRHLIDDVLVREILEPAHRYLDFNEEELEESIAKNEVFADRLVYALFVLGTCGSAGGLVAGFGFARGLSRSLVQLSVLIRDTAGRLGKGVEAIRLSGGDLGELEGAVRLIGERVEAIIERLQQQEHEVLRAEQLAAVGQLAAGMAHELRNPLMSMKILVQGAAAGDCDEEGGLNGRDLTVLEEEITRLEQLTQSFLDFARPPRPEKRLLDVRPLVEQTLAFLAGRLAAAAVRVDLDVPAEPVQAAVDPAQFRQVLLNLMLNALEALAPGAGVTVRLAAEGEGGLTLQVIDSGPGLPAELGERIFDPFTTTRHTGLGLGLSICKRIAAAHGGTITAANRPEGGATFTFRLPPAEGKGEAHATPPGGG